MPVVFETFNFENLNSIQTNLNVFANGIEIIDSVVGPNSSKTFTVRVPSVQELKIVVRIDDHHNDSQVVNLKDCANPFEAFFKTFSATARIGSILGESTIEIAR